jgi:hypothetical protein
LSESSPTAREDAIEQMLQQQPNRREQIFYSGKEAAIISGLPTHWLLQNQERQRLGIPFYSIVDGSLIRFSIEEIFRWEVITCVRAAATRTRSPMLLSRPPARSPCCARRRATSSARQVPATA